MSAKQCPAIHQFLVHLLVSAIIEEWDVESGSEVRTVQGILRSSGLALESLEPVNLDVLLQDPLLDQEIMRLHTLIA